MPTPNPTELAELIQIEVERAVAPYEKTGAPPAVIAKLRELAERYWHENPTARSALRRRLAQPPLQSGTEPSDPAAAESSRAARKEGG